MAKVPYGGPQHRMRKVKGGIARILKPDHPAIVDRTALFRKGIEHASTSPRLLVDGENQRKVGKRITKGAWKGTRIFTLTLVERATCPTSCQQWLSCYDNGMPYARRHILDRALIARLGPEIAGLIAKHGRIAVRLHVLGDFGAEEDLDLAIAYVAAWRWAMMQHEGLHLFGYTAHAPAGAIGRAIHALNVDFPSRARIRFSGQDMGAYGAIVIERPEEAKSVVCPAQTDATDCCATCALCWSMDRTVEFLRHGVDPRQGSMGI